MRSMVLRLDIMEGKYGREQDHKEIEAYHQQDKMSSVWVLQTPTMRGYMEAEVFREVVTTHLGIPSHIVRSKQLAGLQVAQSEAMMESRENAFVVDEYGDIFSQVSHEGCSYSMKHDAIQNSMVAMMKWSGIAALGNRNC